MSFFLLILLNATLMIRPAEVVPALLALPIYQVVIGCCLIVAFPSVVAQLQPPLLAARPISFCVVGMLAAVILSHLSHFFFWGVRESGYEFLKVVLFYLLMVGIVDTPQRLVRFMFWLLVFIVVLAAMAVLQFHHVIEIPGLSTLQQNYLDEATGERMQIARLVSTGIYNDPNDLSLILAEGSLVALYFLMQRRYAGLRWLALGPLFLFGYAFALTQSRGGFLAMLLGLLILFRARYGTRRTIWISLVAVPAMAAIFSGRMTTISTSDETGQARIQLWSQGLGLFKQYPFFGVGHNLYADEVEMVAHNSYIHCYAELGFFGGTIFLSAFVIALWSLYRYGQKGVVIVNPLLKGLHPYVLALVAAHAVGMLTLSRAYVVPTYMILGLATVYLRITPVYPRSPQLRLNQQLVGRMLALSVAFILVSYVFVRLFVRW